MKINGWRRTLAQTLADEARLSEQSRMRATNLNSRGTNLELFGVGAAGCSSARRVGAPRARKLLRRCASSGDTPLILQI